mmetsp:Transcript_20888/g.48534  ORF Transcript_20888/g.48534 Transcript_20888/m.48534 type:complete len:132 (-) Transcript_20888:121-516(-)
MSTWELYHSNYVVLVYGAWHATVPGPLHLLGGGGFAWDNDPNVIPLARATTVPLVQSRGPIEVISTLVRTWKELGVAYGLSEWNVCSATRTWKLFRSLDPSCRYSPSCQLRTCGQSRFGVVLGHALADISP